MHCTKLLVLASLLASAPIAAGKKRPSRGGIARDNVEDVSEGYAGAEDLPTTDATKASFSVSAVSKASVSERSPTKDTGAAPDTIVPHKRRAVAKDDRDVFEGYANAEDVPSEIDEEFPAIVGQLPQSDQELPGLNDVEVVEEVEGCILFLGVLVMFFIFGVCPAVQQMGASDGKGGWDNVLEVALRFSLVQQAVAVLGLGHHVAGIQVLREQSEKEKAKASLPREAARPQKSYNELSSYVAGNQEFDDVGDAHSYARGSGGFDRASTSSLVEEAFAEPEAAPALVEHAPAPTLAAVEGFCGAAAHQENVLDSLGLIDTEEPLL